MIQKINKGYDAHEYLRSLKKIMLDDWNIEFHMDSKDFSDMMKYLEKVSKEIPLQFDEDGLTIRAMSLSVNHIVSLYLAKGEDPTNGETLSNYKFDSGNDDFHKLIKLDIAGFEQGAKKFFAKEEKVIVRIDTIKDKRAEFIFSNMTMWCQLLNPNYIILPPMHKYMIDIMENNDIEKAVFAVEAEEFPRICRMGHFKDRVRNDSNKRVLFIVDKDGVFIKSGAIWGKGRVLRFYPPLKEAEILGDIEYDEQLKKKEELKASSGDKVAKPKALPPCRNTTGTLKTLKVNGEHSIIVDIYGIRLLETLKIKESLIKVTIVTDSCFIIETIFNHIKILCGIPAMHFDENGEEIKDGQTETERKENELMENELMESELKEGLQEMGIR